MTDIAIKVNNLSKRYRIGLKEELHDTFIDSLASWVKSPVSNYKKVRNLSTFSNNKESDDILWALNDVSFDVKYGEVLGIIGKNGAGKSTLLKVLCRITEPTSGEALVNGRVSSLLEVGTGFHPELTGRENVFLNGAILGMTKKEMDRKFDEIVDFSGIEKFIDTPVKRYSSGMGVRLAFSVAAHLDPEIMLIDEVLAVGDINFRRKCLDSMKDLTESGRTIIFVSHNMGSVRKLCERVILLDKGKIVESGPADKVVNSYMYSGMDVIGENFFTQPYQGRTRGIMPKQVVASLKAVRVLDESGTVSTKFSVRDNIFIQMDYDLHEFREYFDVGLYITNDRGERIFATIDRSRDEKGRKGIPGSYSASCRIPGDLLNSGHYFVQASLTEESLIHVIERDVLSFTVEDSFDSEGARGLYNAGEWPISSIRPKLKWTTKKMDDKKVYSL